MIYFWPTSLRGILPSLAEKILLIRIGEYVRREMSATEGRETGPDFVGVRSTFICWVTAGARFNNGMFFTFIDSMRRVGQSPRGNGGKKIHRESMPDSDSARNGLLKWRRRSRKRRKRMENINYVE